MIQALTLGTLKVKLFENRASLGEDAGRRIAETIQSLLLQKDAVNMIFGAAPSQDHTLETLRNFDGIEWERVNAFHMDEYVGLPEDAPQQFGNYLKQRLFDYLPFREVHYINGNARDPASECQRYAQLLIRFPADIVCMGIGENTHIAFNDPHVALFKDPQLVKVVELDSKCRMQQVNDGCFEDIDLVPKSAITLTVPALCMAPHIFCMVPGRNKAEAVYHTLTSPIITEQYPSTILRTHPNATLFLDQESSARIIDKIAIANPD